LSWPTIGVASAADAYAKIRAGASLVSRRSGGRIPWWFPDNQQIAAIAPCSRGVNSLFA